MEEIEVKLQLSTLKSLHTQWAVYLYNYLTSEKGQVIISNGWKAAAITDAISNGSEMFEKVLIRKKNKALGYHNNVCDNEPFVGNSKRNYY